MIKHNCYPSEDDLTALKPGFSYLSENGYGSLNFEAVYKWAYIISAFHEQFGPSPSGLNMLDLGGGLSPVHYYLSNFGTVTNIELNGFESTWFPTSRGMYEHGRWLKHSPENITRIKGNFLEEAGRLKLGSFDFVYDVCSVVHFNPTRSGHLTNYGVYQTGRWVAKLLNPSGVFVSACGVAHPQSYEAVDMLYAENVGTLFSGGGLQYVSKPAWDMPAVLSLSNQVERGKAEKEHMRNSVEIVKGHASPIRLLIEDWRKGRMGSAWTTFKFKFRVDDLPIDEESFNAQFGRNRRRVGLLQQAKRSLWPVRRRLTRLFE